MSRSSRFSMMRSISQHQILRRRNRHTVLLICCTGFIIIFVVYTLGVVIHGTLMAISQYNELKEKNKFEYIEYQQDEITKLLGGPDKDYPIIQTSILSGGQRDMASMERSLTRLLRMRRLMAFDEGEDENDAIHRIQKRGAIPRKECPVKVLNDTVDVGDESLFPTDLFTIEQRRKGAIIFHFIGLIYMFIALAIVCDEFFVPALGVITEALQISDDVAGATFMAAGGSAPEFFTSVFGVFITENNVGIGTIVGSATFNILCVLAFCTLFSKEVLQLTWWPLFRDMSFYVVGLLLLVLFFRDEVIEWHEAFIMFAIYIGYGIFMKYNTAIEAWVRGKLFKVDVVKELIPDSDTITTVASRRRSTLGSVETTTEHRKSIPVLHSGAMFRAGLAHMALDDNEPTEISSLPATSRLEIVQTSSINNHHNGNQPTPPNVINNGKTVLISSSTSTPPKLNKMRSFPAYVGAPGNLNGIRKSPIHGKKPLKEIQKDGVPPVELERSISRIIENNSIASGLDTVTEMAETAFASPIDVSPSKQQHHQNGTNGKNGTKMYPKTLSKAETDAIKSMIAEEMEIEQPIDMSFPNTFCKRCTYIALLPIMFPLYITLPDVKKPHRKKFVIFSFIGSILWIAFYSYLMVWWATTIGVTVGIPTEIMGLTILAAGTSIPDLITSVIVARKGLGDMAVSSSIGSNLFDICVGLPLPWLFYFIYYFAAKGTVTLISVTSNGLVCSVGMLFAMLLILVISIGLSKWKMDKRFGIVMMAAYVVFCILSVMLEMNVILCPLRIVGVGTC